MMHLERRRGKKKSSSLAFVVGNKTGLQGQAAAAAKEEQ